MVQNDAMLLIGLIAGGAVEKTPAFQRRLESLRNTAEHFIEPAGGIPRGAGQIRAECVEHLLGADARLLGGGLAADLVLHVREQLQGGRVAAENNQIAGGVAEIEIGFAQPDGVDVRADEVFIGHVEPGRLHLAGNHEFGVLEEILVVRAAERAVGEHQSGLAAATGATAALRVVGRRGRDVAQIDRIQILDVDAQLHRRRTEQDGQFGGAKIVFALHAKLAGHLRGMFARRNAPHLLDARAEQFDEEFIGRAAGGRSRGHADAVVVSLGAIARAPDEGAGVDAITGHGSAFTFLAHIRGRCSPAAVPRTARR